MGRKVASQSPNPASRARARARAARARAHRPTRAPPLPSSRRHQKKRETPKALPTDPAPSAARAAYLRRGAAGRRAGAASAAPRVAAPKLSAVEDDMAAPGGRGRRRRARAWRSRARARVCVGPGRARARARIPRRPAADARHQNAPVARPARAPTCQGLPGKCNTFSPAGASPRPSPSTDPPTADHFEGPPRRRARPRPDPPGPRLGWPHTRPARTPLHVTPPRQPPLPRTRPGRAKRRSIGGGTDRYQKKKKKGDDPEADDESALRERGVRCPSFDPRLRCFRARRRAAACL